MVQVTNPFALEMDSTAGTVIGENQLTIKMMNPFKMSVVHKWMCFLVLSEGVSLRPYCLEDCVLSCFWGCGVQALQVAFQSHQRELRLSTPELFQEALQLSYLHHQSFKYPFNFSYSNSSVLTFHIVRGVHQIHRGK